MGARDARLISVAAMLRAAAVALAGVVLAVALAARGYSIAVIGVLLGAGLAGAAVMTVVVGAAADRFGRRRTLVGLAMLTALGFAGVAMLDGVALLFVIFFGGLVNGMGRDRGPAGALEQAILPQTTDDAGRTWTIAYYNLSLDAAHAVGALGGAIPALIVARTSLGPGTAHRLTLLLCAAAVAASAAAYLLLSPGVESAPPPPDAGASVDPRTRSAVTRLALLFGIDSLGGGFLSSALIAYWFLQRYGLTETDLALIFFAARVLNAMSHLAAAWVASRIGLLNTMVFTHLPSSLLLMSAPLAPAAPLAVLLFLCREALVEMDVPTRQSYVLAIVPPHARTYASATTNLTRTIGWAIGPGIAGAVMQHLVLAGPLFVAGVLKIGYDILLYRSFRSVRPPEEGGVH